MTRPSRRELERAIEAAARRDEDVPELDEVTDREREHLDAVADRCVIQNGQFVDVTASVKRRLEGFRA